jgi:hypothetical protein
MIVRVTIALVVGAGIGAVIGHFGSCASGTCPLTANPYRGAIFGAILAVLAALSSGHQSVSPESQDHTEERSSK